ncbi:MAG: hypothetical protein R2691_04050 [Solirubrobacterales bacterium]
MNRLELTIPMLHFGGKTSSGSQMQAIPPAHSGREAAAGRTEDDDAAAGHVLAAVLADPLDDGEGAGVADREALLPARPRKNALPAVAP